VYSNDKLPLQLYDYNYQVFFSQSALGISNTLTKNSGTSYWQESKGKSFSLVKRNQALIVMGNSLLPGK
jgi:hypothetical protein